MKTRHHGITAVALFLFALTSFPAAHAQQQLSPNLQAAIGHWQTIHSDGKLGGHVDIYLEGGKLFGKITQLGPGQKPGDVCDKCSGDLKNQPIQGLVILRNFHPDGDNWVGGTAVDPENGKEYKGKIWTTGGGKDELHMRGFIGVSLLGRTETWKRIN